jgi:hypothetical protein
VIRRHVLAALHAGIEAGDEDAARAALANVDPILRGRARRRLEHALIDAALATAVLDARTPEDARHRLRVAALLTAGASPPALPDRGAVARAYGELPAPRPLRAPIATIAATAAAAAFVIGVLCASMGVVTAGPGAFERPPPPPAVGAFRDGGAPARDAAIEQVLADALPRLVAAGAARRPEDVAALRDHAAFAGRGAALRAAWRGLIDCLDRWLALDEERPGYRRTARELRARAIAVSDQLAAAGLGYSLDATLLPEHGRRPPGLSTYRIEDVAFVRANTERTRVLGLRRLDRRDDVAALGMANHELDDPVVLLGQVDEKVAHQVLPILAGADFPIGDDGWPHSRRGRRLAQLAAGAIRRELHASLGADAADAADPAALARAAARCRRLVASSVGRHEAQHGIDRGRGGLRHPQALVAVLGRASGPFALRARLELSAYISQIASDTWLPQLVLWNLARHAFRGTYVGHEESYVAIVILEGLARHFGALPPGPLIRENGEVDRDRLAALVEPLADIGTLELRAAAAALWAELFGEPLVRIYDDL